MVREYLYRPGEECAILAAVLWRVGVLILAGLVCAAIVGASLWRDGDW